MIAKPANDRMGEENACFRLALRGIGRHKINRWIDQNLSGQRGTAAVACVDRDHRRSGVGRIALEALCAEAERLGFLKLVSRIFPENVASLALHRTVGFRERI